MRSYVKIIFVVRPDRNRFFTYSQNVEKPLGLSLQMLSKYYFQILYDKTTDEKLDHFGSFRNLSELFHVSFLDDIKENISINIWN